MAKAKKDSKASKANKQLPKKKVAAPAKPAPKAVKVKSATKAVAKPAQKAAVKVGSKPAPKVILKAKPAQAPAKAPVGKQTPVKKQLPEIAKKEDKKTVPVAAAKASKPEIKPAKKEAGSKASGKPNTKKPKKKEDGDLEDDFLEADDLGGSEIDEYAEELEVVESYSEDNDDEDLWADADKEREDEEIALTDAEGRRFCRHKDCDQISVVEGYCRYHYLLLWKKIQNRKKILMDGKLERYVDELTSRYPDKFLDMIKRDLRTEKDFLSAIQELELDDSAEADFEEEAESFIDEVRGMGDASGTSVDDEEY